MSKTKIFLEFFNKKAGQTTVEFANEIKTLSDPEKLEMATLALAELQRTGRASTNETVE